MRKIIYGVAGVILAVNLYGCALFLAGAAGGAGTAFWLSGKLSDELGASYENSIDATKKALKSLDMDIVKETRSEEITQIRSNYVDGSEVWIDIRSLMAQSAKIDIRVGVSGDKEASAKILDAIKNSL